MRIIVLIGLLVLMAGCGGCRKELAGNAFDKTATDIVAQHVGLTFPQSVEGIRMLSHRGIDPSFIAILKLPGLEKELATEIQGKKKAKFEIVGSLTKDANWWKPDLSNLLLETQYMENGAVVSIWICRQGKAVLMYIEFIQI